MQEIHSKALTERLVTHDQARDAAILAYGPNPTDQIISAVRHFLTALQKGIRSDVRHQWQMLILQRAKHHGLKGKGGHVATGMAELSRMYIAVHQEKKALAAIDVTRDTVITTGEKEAEKAQVWLKAMYEIMYIHLNSRHIKDRIVADAMKSNKVIFLDMIKPGHNSFVEKIASNQKNEIRSAMRNKMIDAGVPCPINRQASGGNTG
jgi:hypothetical protein